MCALVAVGAARAQEVNEAIAANPGRPTVTNPAEVPPVGYLQFEQGYMGSLTSPETAAEHGVNQATKLSLTSRIMVEALSQPYGATKAVGDTSYANGTGDVDLGGQVVLWSVPHEEQHEHLLHTVAVAYLGRVYSGSTGDTDLGSFSNSVVVLIGGDFHGLHYDTNYMVNLQSDDSAGHTIHHGQTGQTASVTWDVPHHDKWSVQGEIYHFTQPFVSLDNRQRPVKRAHLIDALFAGTYTVKPNLVLDFGFSYGFTSTATRWQSFGGFTYLLPKRLWPERKK